MKFRFDPRRLRLWFQKAAAVFGKPMREIVTEWDKNWQPHITNSLCLSVAELVGVPLCISVEQRAHIAKCRFCATQLKFLAVRTYAKDKEIDAFIRHAAEELELPLDELRRNWWSDLPHAGHLTSWEIATIDALPLERILHANECRNCVVTVFIMDALPIPELP